MNYPGIASAQFANTTDVLNIRDSGITVSNISETGFLPEIIVKPKEPTFRSDNFSDQIFSESPLLSDSIQSLSDSLESPAFKANASEINNTDTFLIDLKPKLESEMPAFFVAPKLEDHLLAALEEVRNDPNVELAEPNEVYEAQYEEALVDYNISQAEKQAHENQYITNGFDRIDGDISMNKLRNLSTAVDIDIAILDSGISPHADLNVLTDRQVNFAGTSPVDNCGHGTHVAGIAAAKDNEFGIVGAAPGARLWNVKVLDGNSKKCDGTKDSLIDGLNYVAKHADEIDVVNLSLGGFCDPNVRKLCNSPVLESAINNVIAKGIIVVVAAGNDGVDSINWKPAKFLSVLTVSNLNDSDGKCGGAGNATYRGNDDFLANNTNYGSQVHIAAPGVNILSTSNNGSYAIYSGTSMAAPYVAGSAALYKSFNPNASVSEVINTLLSQSVSLGDRCDGKGYGYILGGDKDNIPEPVLNIKDLIEQ